GFMRPATDFYSMQLSNSRADFFKIIEKMFALAYVPCYNKYRRSENQERLKSSKKPVIQRFYAIKQLY
ncbi:MAG: hypothetical protein LUD71_01620, partial [Clostridiales bacterium]|nr:hypothetical protein [Clostridiales bacterium]